MVKRLGRLGLPVALAFLTACSLLDWSGLKNGVRNDAGGDAALPPGSDGASPLGDATDGADAGPRCHPDAPFDEPVVLAGPINTRDGNEIDGFLTRDELNLYFARDHGDGATYDLYRSSRDAPDAAFGPEVRLDAVASPKSDYAPFLSRDGATLFFASDRSGRDRIYTWSVSASPPAAPTELSVFDAVSSGVSDPFFLGDGITFYFSDSYDTTAMRATASGASFTAPVAVPGIPVPAMRPKVTDDDATLFFAAPPGAGIEDDVYVAHRAAPGAAFTDVARVAELSSSGRDAVTWVSGDGCHVILTSSRGNSADLYAATRR